MRESDGHAHFGFRFQPQTNENRPTMRTIDPAHANGRGWNTVSPAGGTGKGHHQFESVSGVPARGAGAPQVEPKRAVF
jgi:hypothetical protein